MFSAWGSIPLSLLKRSRITPDEINSESLPSLQTDRHLRRLQNRKELHALTNCWSIRILHSKCLSSRRLLSSVGIAPVCCAGGWGFVPWGECAALAGDVIKRTQSLTGKSRACSSRCWGLALFHGLVLQIGLTSLHLSPLDRIVQEKSLWLCPASRIQPPLLLSGYRIPPNLAYIAADPHQPGRGGFRAIPHTERRKWSQLMMVNYQSKHV